MGYTPPSPTQSKNLTAGADAGVSCDSIGETKAVASSGRSRRSRRRAQRNAVNDPSSLSLHQQQEQEPDQHQDRLQPCGKPKLQDQVATEKESSATNSVPARGKTVVVSVNDEAQQAGVDAKPTNRTSVRRRSKATKTVTKVVTDCSLEALRARRNGTAAEGFLDDVQAIEGVSRFLLMRSAGRGGRQHSMRRPTECWPVLGAACGGDAGAMEARAGTAHIATDIVPGGALDDAQRPGRDYVSAQAMYEHFTSLIRAGRLPPDSADVLQSILSHSHSGQLPGLDTRRTDSGDLQLEMIPGFYDPLGVQLQAQQKQQQQQMDAMNQVTAAEFSVYGLCNGGPQLGFCDPSLGGPIEGTVYTCNGSGNGNGSVNDVDQYIGSAEQYAPQLDSHDVHTYSGSLDLVADTAVWPNEDATQDNIVTAAGDDDDDAEVVAMLRSICEVAQQPASPVQRSRCADGMDGEDEFPPSVTISEAERERLRTMQEAFRVRMCAVGSPEWSLPTPHKLLCSGDGAAESNLWPSDEGGRWATNRTLFSYHTSLVDETDETPQRLPLDEGWSLLGEDSQTPAAITDARLSSFFNAMRIQPEEKDGADASNVHNTANTNTPWLVRCMGEGDRTVTPARDGTLRATPHNQLAYQQPTTEKKQLLLDGRSPHSPAVCDFAIFTPPTPAKTTSVLNCKAKPFVPKGIRTAVSAVYFE